MLGKAHKQLEEHNNIMNSLNRGSQNRKQHTILEFEPYKNTCLESNNSISKGTIYEHNNKRKEINYAIIHFLDQNKTQLPLETYNTSWYQDFQNLIKQDEYQLTKQMVCKKTKFNVQELSSSCIKTNFIFFNHEINITNNT